jgi:hypothetical protein
MVILSFIRIARKARLTNYQSRLVQAVFVLGLLSGSLFLIEFDRNAYVLLAFVPVAAFYIIHFFILSKKGLVGETVFLLFVLFVGFYNFLSLRESNKEGRFDIRSYYVQAQDSESLENKRICWLGENMQVYKYNIPATPFINWRLSEPIWQNSNRYSNLTIIANSIERDKPEVIIDPQGLLPYFFKQAPGLSALYTKEGQYYIRKINN